MNRKVELFKCLFNEKSFLPASYYAQKLNVSEKTIYADIDALNQTLIKYPNLNIKLERSPRKGIILKATKADFDQLVYHFTQNDSHSFFNQNARRFTPEYRRLDIVKRLLLKDEDQSLDQLSRLYLVSKSSLTKDIVLINNEINKDRVSLEVGRSTLIVNGDEINRQRAIKQFLSAYIKQQDAIYLTQLLDSFVTPNLFEYLKKLLSTHYSFLTQYCSEYYLNSLLISLTIQVFRLKQGVTIGKADDFLFNHIRYMQSYMIATNLANLLTKEFEVKFTNYDIDYLSKLLFIHRIVDENSQINDSLYARVIKDLINKVGEIERVDLSRNYKLYNSLLSHFPAMITRIQQNIEIVNPLLTEIKQEYAKLFSVLWYALSDIEKQFNVRLNEHELSFLLIHFQVALDKAADAKNILIVCQYGVSSSSLIFNKVKQLLPAKDNIEVYPLSKLFSLPLENVDLIISTLDIENIEVPVVKISSLFNNSDYQTIIQAYVNFILNKPTTELCRKNSWSAIRRFLDFELVNLRVEVKTKQQCLKLLLDELEFRGYVDHRYRESVLNREDLGNTAIEHAVALPHGSPNYVNKSTISLLTLTSPVRWGLMDVDTIIMVSLSEKDTAYINDIYTEIYQLTSERDYILQLKQITSNQDLSIFLNYNKEIADVF
ncbi:BglG family transcription antiterminator [Orbaceae bacterium ac157xtp]